MKNLLLTLWVCLASAATTYANTITICNYTSCSFMISIDGGVGSINVSPMTPPTAQGPISATSGSITSAKIAYVEGGVILDQVNVNNDNIIGFSSITPPCMSTTYTCAWQVDTMGNIFLTITCAGPPCGIFHHYEAVYGNRSWCDNNKGVLCKSC